jgi:soluble lytic murein transglycosylase-like protein
MSFGMDGSAKIYDGPAVITDDGVTPIVGPRLPVSRPTLASATNDPALRAAAQAAHLSPALVAAVAWRESNFQPDRVSRAGAEGKMQLMPATARDVGVDPAKPDENLRGGAAYLRRLLDHYQGDLTLSLAAYNAGPGAVDRYGHTPPYKETEAYVDAIMNRLSDMAAPQGNLETAR